MQALFSLPLLAKVDKVVDPVAGRVAGHVSVVVAAGHPVDRPELAEATTLRGARHVLDAVLEPATRGVHRLEDTHLQGLLVMLGSDARLRAYVERELRPCVHNEQHLRPACSTRSRPCSGTHV